MKARRLWACGLALAVFMASMSVSMADAQVPGEVPDLSIWVNTWFRVTIMRTVYHFEDIGVKPTPAYPESRSDGIFYFKITDWDTTTPGAEFLVVDVYAKESGSWNPIPTVTLNIYYFAGSNLEFIGSAQFDDLAGVSQNVLLVFAGKRNQANTKFLMDGTTQLRTMGGSVFEIDDDPASTERWAGAIKWGGPMVPVSKVPLALQGL